MNPDMVKLMVATVVMVTFTFLLSGAAERWRRRRK